MAAQKKSLIAVLVLIVFTAASAPVFADDSPGVRSGVGIRARYQGEEDKTLAEQYLFRLAKKSKGSRNLAGGVAVGTGILGIVGGVALLSEEEDWLGLNEVFGTNMVIMGGILVAGGTFSLAVESPAERAYRKILPVEDPALRQQACATALADLSKKGRKMRMIGGALNCAAGIAFAAVAAGEDSSNGALWSAAFAGSIAAYLFLTKSAAEKTYRAYLEQSRMKASPNLILGFGPRGGFRFGLSLDF